MAQLMPLPLTVSCSSKIQIGFTFLVPAYLGSPGKMAVKRHEPHHILNMQLNYRPMSVMKQVVSVVVSTYRQLNKQLLCVNFATVLINCTVVFDGNIVHI